MSLIELLFIALSLSMDAFAASICKGLALKQKAKAKQLACVGLYFGGFQALMPLIGYLIGTQFSQIAQQWDHWIAFTLLSLIGLNMIRESRKEEACPDASFGFKAMIPLAIATSIDALAVGISFAFLKIDIYKAVLLIGLVTATLSAIGLKLGRAVGAQYQSKASALGGLILIGIGVKILLEHLGLI